jgi:hypothetical protein
MSQRKSGTCSAPGSLLPPSMPCSPGGESPSPCWVTVPRVVPSWDRP